MGYEIWLLRKAHPGKFGPSPMEMAQELYDKTMGKERVETANENESDESGKKGNEPEDAEAVGSGENADHVAGHFPDPTREPRRRSVVNVERSSMRMWAM